MKYFFYAIPLTLLGIGCGQQPAATMYAPEKRAPVLVLQPFADVPAAGAKKLHTALKAHFPNIMLKPAIALPAAAYYKPRNRYRAEIMIALLRDLHKPDTVTIGITHKDISTQKGKVADWGVMGLGFRPGRACVVSSFRLSQKKKAEQFEKVILHEVGHTAGLPHCPQKDCLMRDAEGGNPLDEEKGFCPACRRMLHAKGFVSF